VGKGRGHQKKKNRKIKEKKKEIAMNV